MVDRMKILITGAAGAVGRQLIKGLGDRYELRGLDRLPIPDLDDVIVGDVGDYATMLKATEGMDATIHLTGVDHDWEGVLPTNLVGTYNMLETARVNGVRRVVYASRAGVHGPQPDEITRRVDMPLQPIGLYTVSKVFGEALGFSYVQQHELEFVAVRIGNFNRNRDQPQHPHQLSHGDCVRVFERAVIHPGVKYEIVYGVSDSTWPRYDLDHGRRVIGYDPQDKSDWRPE
jgi:nucleoside-diphosphate-sugar epimerase